MNYAGNYIAAAGNSAPAPETTLGGTISELEAYLNDMGMVSETLHHRLSGSVLRPDTVAVLAGSKQPDAPRVQTSPTSERIAAITQRVRNITAQMQNALDRLEA